MLLRQGGGLLIDEDAEGALGQAGGGGGSDLLHGGEVEGAGLRAEASGDDLAPLCGQFADLGELLLRGGAFRHGQPSLRLAPIPGDDSCVSLYRPALGSAKRVLASRSTEPRYAP